jgi:hypothetical protein
MKFHQCQLYIITAIFVAILASCTYESTVYTSNEEFWEGTDGLLFSFLDNNPPEIVYENMPFNIAFDLENLGAHTATAYMTLSIEDDYMCILDDNNDCSLFNPLSQLPASVQNQFAEYDAAIKEYQTQLKIATDSDQITQLNKQIQTAQKNKQRLQSLIAIENPYKTKLFSLEGKSIFNYQGGSDVISYNAQAKTAGSMSETHDIQIIATACYEYVTEWNQEVCIDTDINKMNIFPGACEATDISLNSQGAPLAITEIETKMLPTGTGYIRPMFIIHVQNSGNGRIINKEKTQHACTATGIESKDYNMVFLKEFMLSSEQLKYDFNGYDINTGKELNPSADGDTISCSPNPLILKNDGNDYITCIVNEDAAEDDMLSLNQAPYATELSLLFEYGYTESQTKEVTIKRI